MVLTVVQTIIWTMCTIIRMCQSVNGSDNATPTTRPRQDLPRSIGNRDVSVDSDPVQDCGCC